MGVVLFILEQVHVCSVLICFSFSHGSNFVKNTLACDERFLIGSEALSFLLEDFGLHLTLQASSNLSFLLAIMLDAGKLVLIVTHLTDSGQSLRVSLGKSSCCWHLVSLHRFKLGASGATALMSSSDLASKSCHPE